MPMRFSDLARKTKRGVLDLGDGDTIVFHYRHHLVTPRLVHDVLAMDDDRVKQAPEEAAAALEALSAHVVDLLADWDVLEDDGSPMPLTVARLADIPMAVQYALVMACIAGKDEPDAGEAVAPGAPNTASAPASGAGSRPKANSVSRRSGTRS